MTSEPKRLGRPPSGIRPGEKVSQYPQISLRVPPEIDRLLKDLSTRTGEAQWRVVARALRAFARQLGADRSAATRERRAVVPRRPTARRKKAGQD